MKEEDNNHNNNNNNINNNDTGSGSIGSKPPLSTSEVRGTTTMTTKVGYSGRGGAGNVRVGRDGMEEEEEEEKKRKEVREREMEVVRDVEMGLKVPERAYFSGGEG